MAVENLVKMRLNAMLKAFANDYELDLSELQERYLDMGVEEESEGSVTPVKKAKKAKKAKTPGAPVKKKKVSDSEEEAEDDREGKCTCTTAKGLLCRNRALKGFTVCGIHNRSSSSTKETQKEKPKNKKKKEKVHTHEIDVEVEEGECELCESHGNQVRLIADPESAQEFEAAGDDERKLAEEFEAEMKKMEEWSESEAEGSEYTPSEEGEEDFV